MTDLAVPYLRLPHLVSPDEQRALLDDALLARANAELSERTSFQLVAEQRLLGPVRNRFSAVDGPRSRLHRDELPGRIAAAAGVTVRPSLSCYLYYDRGDFIGLHQDQPSCSLAVLVWLAGDTGPLILHPELNGLPAQALLLHAVRHSGHPPGGVAVRLHEAPLLLYGNRVPHHRPPVDHEIIIGAFCFDFAPARSGPREVGGPAHLGK